MRDWLAYRARVTPDATALIDGSSGAQQTFEEFDAAVEECAGRLAALGAEVEAHVGMVLESRTAAVRLVHAASRVGAVLVPLSPSLTAAELGPRVEQADLDLLVHEDATRSVVDGLDVPLAAVDPDAGDELLAESPTTFDLPEWTFDDDLLMLFTSGTTGVPKLVRLTASNVLASAIASAFRLGTLPDDTWCSPLSLASTGGLAPAYRTVLYGSTLLLAPTETEPLLDVLSEYRPTGVSLVPVMLQRLLDAGDLPSSLRSVLVGGAHAPPSLVERCVRRDVPVCPTYGMTEAASQIATARPQQAAAHPGTVGNPLMFAGLTIVGASGSPLPEGERGEIVVSGPSVTPGYYGDPDATARSFCAYGLRTGDLGFVDEHGLLHVDGRLDDRINTGGQTVDPGEVVEVVSSHPAVAAVAVVGVPDEEWGECVGALVEPVDGTGPTTDDVRSFCDGRLASYKRPRVISFGSLPRTASGTVDREQVRSILSGG